MKKIVVIMLVLMMLTMSACAKPAETATPAGDDSKPAEAKAEPAEEVAEMEEIKIQIGHSDPTTNLAHVSLTNYSNWVSEQTGGQVVIEVFPAESLGTNAEMAEMLTLGNQDAMLIPSGLEAKYAPMQNILGLPFLFESYEQVYAVLDSEVGESLTEGLEDSGMFQVAYWENGLRQITNSVRPIESPADLEGMKIRTPDDSMTLAIFSALGANPSPLAFSELYLALQQGTYDGQENPVSNIHSSNFQDVQDYISLTNHKYEHKGLVFSKEIWDTYPADIQAILIEGGKMFGKEHRKAIVDSADTMTEELEAAGMTVSRPNTVPFQEATASVYGDYMAEKEWAEAKLAEIEAIKATVK